MNALCLAMLLVYIHNITHLGLLDIVGQIVVVKQFSELYVIFIGNVLIGVA